eukprot:CAMPEP_0114329232 /NCGR_PEP_ID=MMETSP0101-20121206/946_1 /TAXON_ID=38822 ORGANISM="Pteridomonas danica, Strain PT" /NCGR_SAMPLE_ID=MMETSP0101 /ASSEMBLY_ACC=CAM_ASM_000211 /LENGTH=507 /DNA_ID=CAMNT_0001458839 /DNA_START=261 /DNA_END=1784 /DNA_ORIENTATION=-
MTNAQFLPLSDSGIVKRATVGDLDALDGALIIKRFTDSPLSMRLATKLITMLVSYDNAVSDSSPQDMPDDNNHFDKVSPHVQRAWQIWTEFRHGNDEEVIPDLRMFNVALTVASRMKKIDLVDDLYLSLQRTPLIKHNNTHEGREGIEDQVEGVTIDLDQHDNDDIININDNDDNKQKQSKAASVEINNEAVVFLQPDIFTYNILIDAYGRCHHLYRSLELYDEMKHRGIKPDVITFNSLAKAYVKEKRLDDALALLREAGEQGITANYITFRTMCHAFGDSNSMIADLHEQERSLLNTMAKSSNHSNFNSDSNKQLSEYELLMKNATSWNQSSEACSLMLDLHILNISEAKAKVSVELEYLHQFYREDGENDDEKDKHKTLFSDDDDNDDDNKIQKQESDVLLPDLILITGIGKNSLKKHKKGVMKLAMIDYLTSQGIVFHEAPSNPGRLIITSTHLKTYFEQYRIQHMHTSYSDYISLRYMILPSVLASVVILPKVSEFYNTFMA